MKTILRRTFRISAYFVIAMSYLMAQEATAKRNVNLRSDPSSDNPAVELLQAGTKLTVLDPSPQNGYYHVKVADGQDGWVWGKNISISKGAGGSPVSSPTESSTPSTRVGPSEIYPDSSRTPGVPNPDISQDNIADNLCSQSWSTKSIRPPVSYTGPLKLEQLQEYGDTVSDSGASCAPNSDNPKCYEEDHLISLEDGGHPRDRKNLWPEPYHTMVNGKVVGARQKDLVEGFIHDEICFDIPNSKKNSKIPAHISITLQRGQEILANDWYSCYVSIQKGEDCR